MSEFQRKDEARLSVFEVLDAGKPLLELFGVEIDPLEQPTEFIEAITQIDPRFQGGREMVRYQLEQDEREWDSETKGTIMAAAEKMRMLETETPLIGHYDAVIALGGARQSNLDRARYPVHCAADTDLDVSFKHLIVAGSSRRLNQQEQENTSNYAPGAQTEFDLCVGAARTVALENPGLVTSVSYTDEERAGTPKIIEDVLTSLQRSDVVRVEDAAIAAVTTQIYQVSTDMDLRRIAKQFGITDVYVAGNPSDAEIVARRTTATYLTEVIRTLKAAAMAVEAEAF